jgi:hypothetical protein
MMATSKKVVIAFIDLLNIRKKIKKMKQCCEEKERIIRILNKQIDEYNVEFAKKSTTL